MKILIVEDNNKLLEDISKYLKEEGYIVDLNNTYKEASEKIAISEFDVILVDIGLPDGNGLDLIREVKLMNKNCGVLIISAKNSLEDKIEGLDLGADDYITKPFHLAELNARLRSIIRRKKFDGNSKIQIENLCVDTFNMSAKIDNTILDLTKMEYELLLYFIYNKNRVLTKENIAEHLWEDNIDFADNFDFIYNHIKNLRKKIVKAGGNDHIKSVYGIGYKFELQ